MAQIRNNSTIIYVNFSPYKNTGRIFDFLLSHFQTVCVFYFNFHELQDKDSNKLIIYRNSKKLYTRRLLQIPVPERFIFILLPIRSIFILLQMVFYTIWIKSRIKKIDVYFTVNAFTAWIGMSLKRIGLVNKTLFWVWDYYPPKDKSKIIMAMRWIYWHFDKVATKVDRVVFLNKRLIRLRKQINVLDQNKSYTIIPIGTDPHIIHKKKRARPITLGFIGVLKKSQGLDLIFDQAEKFPKKFTNIYMEIIGDGPDSSYFRERSKKAPFVTTFHGLQTNPVVINQILGKCTIGFAPYVPEPTNVSYYGDPSKIKNYLSIGLPVITTNVFVFSKEIEEKKAGIIINYSKPEELSKSISKITANYERYQKNARELADKYNYKKIYPAMFKFTS